MQIIRLLDFDVSAGKLGQSPLATLSTEYVKTHRKKVLLVCICFAAILLASVVWLVFSPKEAKASVTYLGIVDGKGHWRLQFGVTNIGECSLFTSTRGQIEIEGQTNRISAGARTPKSQLRAGEGHVVELILSEAKMNDIVANWRYSCSLASDGFRSRLYRWQWGPRGPGARVNWLIPQKWKGMPLSIRSQSDWLERPTSSGPNLQVSSGNEPMKQSEAETPPL
ncbi:MAG TPA: hypothetical protein VEH27_01475 [Methylomirabilota bacterium]|nr:hypothetical protein [Methylomirabilota bacterium]